jgi:ABC-type long-subunit fatty acid transport system fused permease/ATPase subunit
MFMTTMPPIAIAETSTPVLPKIRRGILPLPALIADAPPKAIPTVFKNSRLFIRIFGHLVPQGCGKVYNMQGQQASEGTKFMARRRKASAQQETQGLPLWAQIAVVLWMVGTLVWFFSDHKIQQWLAAMISDLIQWR